MLFLLISFIAGILTVLAPCVLPLLPVIVGGTVSVGVDRKRAFTVVASLGASVILFTLILKVSAILADIPQYGWEWISGGILIGFGFVTVLPEIWERLGFVNALSRSSNRLVAEGYQKQSRLGDILVGAALGPVFSTCSPTYFVILATVLPASFFSGLVDLFAYTLGLTITLLLVALVGQRLVLKLGLASDPRGWLRRGIGILFIIVGLVVFSGAEQKLEAWLLRHVYDITVVEQKLLRYSSDRSNRNISTEQGTVAQGKKSADEKALIYRKSPELASPDGYINTPSTSSGQASPITIGEFKGKKVVLIDIWTYSCINCQRTLPYLKEWYDKYRDQGLEIIGVHTPEFAFEHKYENVADAVARFGLEYPNVLDNEYATWNAFGNQFWPRKYLVDIDGYIVYDHAGEGNYDITEKAIQDALAERNNRLGKKMPTIPITIPINVSIVDSSRLQSPEIYFGATRNEYLINGKSGAIGLQILQLPEVLLPNALYLGGAWNFEKEFAVNRDSGARIRYKYSAKNVYLVASADAAVKIKITRDGGQPLGSEHGADIDASGEAIIQQDRLYELIKGADYGTHTIEITIEGAGLRAYTFTFG